MIRAKFYVGKLDNPDGATAAQVGLNAVCRGVENSLWAQATPCGSITMSVKNDAAFEQFEMGAEYEVTFRKVAKPALGDGHPAVEAITMHGQVVCETCGHSLGYTEESAAKYGHLAQYTTPEYRAEMRVHHDEVYGPAQMQAVDGDDAPESLRDVDPAMMTRVLGGEPTCLIFSRVDDDGQTVISHTHDGDVNCRLDVQVKA